MKTYMKIDTTPYDYDIVEGTVYVGSAMEVEALYKSIRRATEKFHTSLVPMFVERPKFAYERMYGLVIRDEDNMYYVINGDTVLSYIVSGNLV